MNLTRPYPCRSLSCYMKNITPKIRKAIFILPLAVIFVLTVYVTYLYVSLSPQLANADFDTALPMTTKILDRNGKLLYEVGGPAQREVIEADEIPQLLKDATILAEDKNFYTHVGIDPKAIARALSANVKSQTVVQGGSTITQQLVKNTFIKNPKQTMSRKINEAIMSFIVESRVSKETILTAYFNNVQYGGNII